MTTVSATGPTRIQSWMVPKLFGPSTPDQAGDPAKEPLDTVMSLAKMSGATADAVGTLRHGGSNRQSAALSNAIVKRLNAMTSDQITEAMYSGKGLAFAGGLVDSPNTTFVSIMKNYTDSADRYREFAADDASSADQRQASAEQAVHIDNLVATLQKAFDDKTLVFHKASEIEGLDFREHIEFNDDLTAPSRGADLYDINSSYLTENHLEDHILGVAGITLFMSW